MRIRIKEALTNLFTQKQHAVQRIRPILHTFCLVNLNLSSIISQQNVLHHYYKVTLYPHYQTPLGSGTK